MIYGSTAYGSTAFGGGVNGFQVFFATDLRAPDINFEAMGLYSGSEELYSVFTQQNSEPGSGSAGVLYHILTSHDVSETPQLQTTIEGNGQSVIAAAPFITVRALIDGVTWGAGQIFGVTGRPGQ